MNAEWGMDATQRDRAFGALVRTWNRHTLGNLTRELEAEQAAWEAMLATRASFVQQEAQARLKILDAQILAWASLCQECTQVAATLRLAFHTAQLTLQWQATVDAGEREDTQACHARTQRLATYLHTTLPELRRVQREVAELLEREEGARLRLQVDAWRQLWDYRTQFDPYSVYVPLWSQQQERAREAAEAEAARQALQYHHILQGQPQTHTHTHTQLDDAHAALVAGLRQWRGQREEELWGRQARALPAQQRQRQEEQVMWALVRSTRVSMQSVWQQLQDAEGELAQYRDSVAERRRKMTSSWALPPADPETNTSTNTYPPRYLLPP